MTRRASTIGISALILLAVIVSIVALFSVYYSEHAQRSVETLMNNNVVEARQVLVEEYPGNTTCTVIVSASLENPSRNTMQITSIELRARNTTLNVPATGKLPPYGTGTISKVIASPSCPFQPGQEILWTIHYTVNGNPLSTTGKTYAYMRET